ncbi:MAG: hypothetical protein IAI49_07415 [Candidatus Eremiobacteraeota bacterium]|nr:hypothetical protein [Candidatus Eremiobacteraeota bacterium]
MLTQIDGVMGEALFVVDVASGSLSFANSFAVETFGLRAPLAGVLIADLVPELADLATRRFTSLAKTIAGERRVDVRASRT